MHLPVNTSLITYFDGSTFPRKQDDQEMRLSSTPSIYLTLLISPYLVFAANQMLAECGHQTYGSPQLEDCHSLLESFADHLDTKIRVFDEEQQRTTEHGSWPGLLDITGAAHLDDAVQLPRYFSFSKGVLNSAFLLQKMGGGEEKSIPTNHVKYRFLQLRPNVLRRLRRRPLPFRRHLLGKG